MMIISQTSIKICPPIETHKQEISNTDPILYNAWNKKKRHKWDLNTTLEQNLTNVLTTMTEHQYYTLLIEVLNRTRQKRNLQSKLRKNDWQEYMNILSTKKANQYTDPLL